MGLCRPKSIFIVYTLIIILAEMTIGFKDVPCAAVKIYNSSVICVCNVTYCDTVVREAPRLGTFVSYVSTKSGLRFRKTSSFLEEYDYNTECSVLLELDPETKFQTIEGFGGGVTDAVGINLNQMGDPQLKNYLIQSYFGRSGLEYNMIRTPMGACDFSLRNYTYNDLPEGDRELNNFSLAYEDFVYKIPFIHACKQASTEEIHIIGSMWSPPKWMKTNHAFVGIGFVLREYYQTLADYYVKFVDEYYKNGINIWAVTTGNEPLNGISNAVKINDLGWTVPGLADWIADNLAPTMRRHHPFVKLIGVDDQRYTLPLWFTTMLSKRKEVAGLLDGIALHFYFDKLTPPDIIPRVLANYPHLFVISTEASYGTGSKKPIEWGSWERANGYAKDIMEDLNYNMTGWIDWNLCLNDKGGPHWIETGLDAAILVNLEKKEFYKQPMYYAIGHFSKLIQRGSQRIKVVELDTCSSTIEQVAFLTPRNTIVAVLLNGKNFKRDVILKLGWKQARVTLLPQSFTTIELNNE